MVNSFICQIVQEIVLVIYACLRKQTLLKTQHYMLPRQKLQSSHVLFMQVNDSTILIPLSIFVIYNIYSLSEYIRTGQTVQAWWNNQRMARLITMIAQLFGFLSVILKLLGLSETTFEVTKKDQNSSTKDINDHPKRFTFDNSPFFVPGIAILLVNLSVLGIGLVGFNKENEGKKEWGIGELVCSTWVVLCFWAFLKGLFRKGKYGIPFPTIYKSGALALLFVQLSNSTSHQVETIYEIS